MTNIRLSLIRARGQGFHMNMIPLFYLGNKRKINPTASFLHGPSNIKFK